MGGGGGERRKPAELFSSPLGFGGEGSSRGEGRQLEGRRQLETVALGRTYERENPGSRSAFPGAPLRRFVPCVTFDDAGARHAAGCGAASLSEFSSGLF